MDTWTLPPTTGPTVPLPAPSADAPPPVPWATGPAPSAEPAEPAEPAESADRPVADRLRVARLLVLLELLVAAVSAVESAVVVGVGVGSPGAALVTAGVAVVLARQSGRLGRGRVTRTLRATQWAFLLMAAVDLVVALVVVHAPLLPVSLLVRVVLPVAVLALTHAARPPGRRRARRLRRATAAGAR